VADFPTSRGNTFEPDFQHDSITQRLKQMVIDWIGDGEILVKAPLTGKAAASTQGGRSRSFASDSLFDVRMEEEEEAEDEDDEDEDDEDPDEEFEDEDFDELDDEDFDELEEDDFDDDEEDFDDDEDEDEEEEEEDDDEEY
jgi:hypothetical protein